MQAAIPGSDLATLEAQAASASKAYNFEQALALYLKAAEMTKAIASDNSPQYAAALVRLGALCRAWDRLEQAHGYYSQAIPILERVFGPSYLGLAEPLYFLAMEAEINKDLPRAESLYQRVLDLGPSREGSLALMGKARVLRGLGRDDEAGAVDPGTLASFGSAKITATLPDNPDASGAYRVGGGVTAPSLTYKTEPGYGQEARIMKFQGTVILQIVVGVDGVSENISVVRQLGFGLDEKAVEAVREWRFKPGMKDAVPVPVSAQVEVNFRLL
jgi:TonB family protein